MKVQETDLKRIVSASREESRGKNGNGRPYEKAGPSSGTDNSKEARLI